MVADLQVSFHNMDATPSVEDQVRRRAGELEQFSDRIPGCRVLLEAASRRRRHGTMYHVTVDPGVPGGRILANRETAANHAHEDLHVAIRDAFDAARRRLQDRMRRLDGQTKQHAEPRAGFGARASSGGGAAEEAGSPPAPAGAAR